VIAPASVSCVRCNALILSPSHCRFESMHKLGGPHADEAYIMPANHNNHFLFLLQNKANSVHNYNFSIAFL